MSLGDVWKNSGEMDNDLSSLIKSGVQKIQSKDPLIKLKRSLLAGAVWGVLIAAGYVFILVKFPVWQVFFCIGTALLFTLWAAIRSFSLYTEMGRVIPDSNLLQQLEGHYIKIKKWLIIQQQVGLFIYPISAAGGFMIGGALGSGKSITYLMQKPVMIVALLITIAILTPVCYFIVKWMCKKALGNYLEQLKYNIDKLKSIN